MILKKLLDFIYWNLEIPPDFKKKWEFKEKQ
jgi:hypothetical protein